MTRSEGVLPTESGTLTSQEKGGILGSVMVSFFTKGRRDLIAKTFVTLVQIAVGGAIAGNLLSRLTVAAKVGAGVAILLLFVLSIVICPTRSDERDA